MPLANRLDVLQSQLDKAQARFKEVIRDEATINEQQVRIAELAETGRTLAGEAAERMKQVQALGDELNRSSAVKDELIAELARIQARQRDAVAQAEAAEDQIKRAEAMYKSLDQRRSQLAFSEKKIGAVEAKMTELAQKSHEIDDKMKAIAERESLVNAVKSEVENVYQISARSRADLQYVSDHREEVAALRRQVQELLATASATEDKINAIDARRKTVDEVQSKTSLISNLLEDVRVNLETLGEQKAVIDHVAERLARMEFVMQEAGNTLRNLQHERELAERIEESIKQLRARTAAKTDEVRKPAASA
jgi:chromosome segregation ATPase